MFEDKHFVFFCFFKEISPKKSLIVHLFLCEKIMHGGWSFYSRPKIEGLRPGLNIKFEKFTSSRGMGHLIIK